jgi:16S rRNA processing protein RimM
MPGRIGKRAMKQETTQETEFVTVGKIVASFGLRGQVKVEPLTNIAERFDIGKTLYLDGEPRKIVDSRLQKKQFILKLEGINKIEQADALKWMVLEVPASEKPELDDDEYMVDDLIGMKVVTTDGKELGAVEEVLTYPAHDILVVGTVMIPAVQEFVEMVDFDAETITVRLIDGMLELNDVS